jgi:tetratricopeptide (TPR) repeat protein
MASLLKSFKRRLAMSKKALGLTVVAALALASGRIHAAEITATVRATSGTTATVAIEGPMVPSVGDKAEIFFKIPGADEPISVATGKVEKVEGDSVQITIENATGEVEKGHLARISSEKPQKRSAIVQTPPSSASTPSSPADLAEQFFNEAKALYDKHDYDGAIAAYTKAIAANPNDAGAYANRAQCYEHKSDYARATEDYTRAILLNPNLTPAYTERAHSRIGQQDFSPAVLEDCNKAIALDGNQARAYELRGIYYAHEGAMKLAEADWEKAIALDPALEEDVNRVRASWRAARKESSRRKR